MSTKTGFAPVATIAPIVAIYVNGVVITSSPFFIPKAFNDKNASVPLPTPIANLAPTLWQIFFHIHLRNYKSKLTIFKNFSHFVQNFLIVENCSFK